MPLPDLLLPLLLSIGNTIPTQEAGNALATPLELSTQNEQYLMIFNMNIKSYSFVSAVRRLLLDVDLPSVFPQKMVLSHVQLTVAAIGNTDKVENLSRNVGDDSRIRTSLEHLPAAGTAGE
ncbi:hypothetical protein EVAR_58575_1 [Eumeta japonica]|uniref:Uncharacterized protein n=1 Tax=Eumeta variegata TaxID=151549 RepID=A0A4C1Z676_EUMVA|nr:hypothetical protein EVAR_58575_1 [Eumeta japonica]